MNENKKKESVFKITQSLIFTNIRKIIVVTLAASPNW